MLKNVFFLNNVVFKTRLSSATFWMLGIFEESLFQMTGHNQQLRLSPKNSPNNFFPKKFHGQFMKYLLTKKMLLVLRY